MKVSNNFSEKKLYSRYRFYDGLPYTSEDRHQEEDSSYTKLSKILNSLIGSGLLDEPVFSVSGGKLRLNNKVSANIDGDVFILANTDNVYPLDLPADNTTVVAVCWLKNILASTELHEYGGLCNSTISNDLLDPELNIQVSTRYQICWNLAVVNSVLDYNKPSISTISMDSLTTDTGVHYSVSISASNIEILDRVYKVSNSDLASSVDDLIYIIPLANINNSAVSKVSTPINLTSVVSKEEPDPSITNVWYNPSTESVKMYIEGKWRNVGGANVIKSSTEPTDVVLNDGTIWYNPTSKAFKIYISDVGFVQTSSDFAFIQLQATYQFNEEYDDATNLDVYIPIDTYLSTDVLQLNYEGAELIEGTHYILDKIRKKITLTDFTVVKGDKLTFTIYRLVGSSEIIEIMPVLESHIVDKGSNEVQGHVKLSDSIDNTLDSSGGVAATPKAVYESTVITDSVTSKRYRLTVTDGVLGIVEVE